MREANKSNDENLEHPSQKGAYALLAVKGVLMIAAVVLVSSTKDISNANPCELQTALEPLSLKFSPPCKHITVKEKSNDFSQKGLAVFSCSSILFLVILCACLWPSENKELGFLIIYLIDIIIAVIFSILICTWNSELEVAKRNTTSTDFIRLQNEMFSSLQKNFKSDNTSSSDEISSNWNIFFIKYECCAVREVLGTTNDFDTTPWCTTSGSCHSTASQIPKTCCKDVTTDDYQNAPSACHASVNSGTYKQSCINQVKTLSVVNIDECLVSIASISLFTLVAMQIFEAMVTLVVAVYGIVDFVRNRKQTTRENQTTPDNGNCDNVSKSQQKYENNDFGK